MGTGYALAVINGAIDTDTEILIGHHGGIFAAVADVPATNAEVRGLRKEEVRISQ